MNKSEINPIESVEIKLHDLMSNFRVRIFCQIMGCHLHFCHFTDCRFYPCSQKDET